MQPRIMIPMDIKNKMQFIVDNCDMEVSGLGTVVFDKEENAYRVTDIILLEQEVGATHTDLDDKAVAKAVYDMRESEGELAFWWHSHVDMESFWSKTDVDTMEKIGKNGLCVAVVLNKREEMRGAIVMSPEDMPSVTIDDVDIQIEYDYAFDTTELLLEIKAKVKVKQYLQPDFHGTYGSYVNGVWIPKDKTVSLGGDARKAYDVLHKNAKDEWSRMTKQEKSRYIGFDDFMDEFQWGEATGYNCAGNSSVAM